MVAHRLRAVAAALFVSIGLWPAGASAGLLSISNFYVFGDSTLDPGNAQAAAAALGLGDPAPAALGYFNGRFSNGPTYADLLNQAFGDGAFFAPAIAGVDTSGPVPVPIPSGATNFAIGGANVLPPPGDPVEAASSLAAQLALFVAGLTAGVVPALDAQSLVILNIGGNDVRDALSDALAAGMVEDAQNAAVAATVAGIEAAISALALSGAERFLVANVPNVGLFPERLLDQPLAAALGGQLSALFNDTLAFALDALAMTFSLDIALLDFDGLFDDILASGTFTETALPCISSFAPPVVCSNPDDFLFWDPVHFTAAAQALGFDAAVTALVPEPAALGVLLLMVGLAVCVIRLHGRPMF